jgi:hypothetical protein
MSPWSTDAESYLWLPLLTDMLTGVGALAAMIPVGLFLGGFSFMLPWLIVTPLVLFSAGFLRGASSGKIWAKAATISAPTLVMVLSSNGLTIFTATLTTVLATVGGIVFSRYGMTRRPNGDVDRASKNS